MTRFIQSRFASAFVIVSALLVVGCAKNEPASDHAGGAAQVAQTTSHERMVSTLEQLAERSADDNMYQGDGQARQLRAALQKMPADAPVVDRIVTLRFLGLAELQAGNEDASIEALSEACRLLPQAGDKLTPRQKADITFRLGVAYMRKGETANCCNRFTPDSCILPIRGGGVHEDKSYSQSAIEQFAKVQTMVPADDDINASARWLMNVAYMTLDEYPDKVPAKYRVSPERFKSHVDFPRFANVSEDLGLARFDCCGSVIIDDLNGDGKLDILSSTWEPRGELCLFTRNADGKFDEHDDIGLTGIYGGLNLMPADYDNDGDLDFVVLRGAWLASHGHHPNSLIRNNGDGTFTDVTFDAGLGSVAYPTQTAGWADYDGDGDLDLFIGNESTPDSPAPSQLFQNQGDGTFKDVAAQAGVTNDRFAKAVSWGDYDNDGDPDLYVSNYTEENRLYQNQGNGTFVDVAPSLGVTRPIKSFPAWFWDYNNDGNLDIFVSSDDGRTSQVARYYLGQTPTCEPSCLYRGDGKGGFMDVTREAGLTQPMLTMGSNFGDINGDGFLDMYLGTGDPDYSSLMPNLLFLNQGGRTFADVTMAAGVGILQKGHGVAFADVDDDGDLDLFEQLGGANLGDRYRDALFLNPGFGNHHVTVLCTGTRSNRSAIGARIRVETDGPSGRQTIYRSVNTGGSFGANPLRQFIGVGKADRIASVEVYWPTTGITQRIENVPLDSMLRAVEGKDDSGQMTIGQARP